MACDCIKNVNKLLQEKLNGSAGADYAIMMDGTTRISLRGMYHKKNKNGEYQQKWTYVNLLAEYCPFCGKPYKEI